MGIPKRKRSNPPNFAGSKIANTNNNAIPTKNSSKKMKLGTSGPLPAPSPVIGAQPPLAQPAGAAASSGTPLGFIKSKIKPIFADASSKILIDQLRKLKFDAKPVLKDNKYDSNKQTIFCATLADKKKVTEMLETQKISANTFTEAADKPTIFTLKGLAADEPSEAMTQLTEVGLAPTKVTFLRFPKPATPGKPSPPPIFLVHFEKGSVQLRTLKFEHKLVGYKAVTWERFLQANRRTTQCYRCQAWGHSGSNCLRPPKCFKCTGGHLSADCQITQDGQHPTKCVNCDGDHASNSRACPARIKYEKAKKAAAEKRRPQQQPRQFAPQFGNAWHDRQRALTMTNENFPPIHHNKMLHECGHPPGSNSQQYECGHPPGSNSRQNECGPTPGSNIRQNEYGHPPGSISWQYECGHPPGSNSRQYECGLNPGSNSYSSRHTQGSQQAPGSSSRQSIAQRLKPTLDNNIPASQPRTPLVEQRDVPGIDCAHLAMDTEEGVEVVWNEVQFSERKNFKAQEEKIQTVFENLTQLEHPNIVKFHRYWTDTHNDKPRVIFITEYMSSGSLKQFLKRTKRNVKKLPLQAWKRWCTQILSALSYLHSCTPPIIHGNLTCDTIFIQHNGLVKIGSVAPDAINHHVKTCRENIKNMHFIAPEYGAVAVNAIASSLTPAIDIFSFGMCALEMAALEIQGNGDSGTMVTPENIQRTIESLEEGQQKDFIAKCLSHDPAERPSAKELLFHPLLFEVHSLKLLVAHCLLNTAPNFSETITDEMMRRRYKPDVVLADIPRVNDPVEFKLADVPAAEKLEKFLEDVKYGIYPLTAFSARQPPTPRPRAVSPETAESVKSASPEPLDIESRKVVNMICSVKPIENSSELLMTILLRMDDKMNRQLTCQISQDDTAIALSHELVHLGFINDNDREKIASMIEDTLLQTTKQQQLMGATRLSTGDGHPMPVPIHTTS